MSEKSKAHRHGMNHIGAGMFPDGLVPWTEATPPPTEGTQSRIGRLRGCGYCGSMHPADVVAAIKAGAKGEWADRKYGWPHKAYFDGIPNPHAGLPEVYASANFKSREDWIQSGPNSWHEPPRPAPALTHGKFYSVHLQDATSEERAVIEEHLGISFDFKEDGGVAWKPFGK